MSYITQTDTFSENGRSWWPEAAIHVLHRDETGLLTYKKVYVQGNETIELNSGEGFAFGSLDALLAGVDASGNNINESQWRVDESGQEYYEDNVGNRAFEQMSISRDKITYYLNSDGNLVARHEQNFTYAATQDGATENWIG